MKATDSSATSGIARRSIVRATSCIAESVSIPGITTLTWTGPESTDTSCSSPGGSRARATATTSSRVPRERRVTTAARRARRACEPVQAARIGVASSAAHTLSAHG